MAADPIRFIEFSIIAVGYTLLASKTLFFYEVNRGDYGETLCSFCRLRTDP